MRRLPYADDYVDEVHAIHLIEHFRRTEVEDVLREWQRVLKPGGLLVLECPCLDKIAHWLTSKEVQGQDWVRLTLLGLYGEYWLDEGEAMLHKWCYAKSEMSEILTDLGYRGVSHDDTPLYHVPARDMRVTARKA